MVYPTPCDSLLDRITILDESVDADFGRYASQQVQQELTPPRQVLTTPRVTSDLTALSIQTQPPTATTATATTATAGQAQEVQLPQEAQEAQEVTVPSTPIRATPSNGTEPSIDSPPKIFHRDVTSRSYNSGRASTGSSNTSFLKGRTTKTNTPSPNVPLTTSKQNDSSYGHPVVRSFDNPQNPKAAAAGASATTASTTTASTKTSIPLIKRLRSRTRRRTHPTPPSTDAPESTQGGAPTPVTALDILADHDFLMGTLSGSDPPKRRNKQPQIGDDLYAEYDDEATLDDPNVQTNNIAMDQQEEEEEAISTTSSCRPLLAEPSPTLKFLTEVEVDPNGDAYIWSSETGRVEEFKTTSFADDTSLEYTNDDYISAGGSQNGEGSDFPSNDEILSHNKKRKQRQRIAVAICFLLLLIVLLSIFLSRSRSDDYQYTLRVPENDGSTSIAVSGENDQETEPSMPPSSLYNPLMDTIEYETLAPLVEDPSKLLDESTPQGRAFLQMIQEGWGEDSFRMVQRFSLVTVFEATQKDSNQWHVDAGWQGYSEDECLWIGVSTCRNINGNMTASNLQLGTSDDTANERLLLYCNDRWNPSMCVLCLLIVLVFLPIVAKIFTDDNNLTGELPSEICLLSYITSLTLANNFLHGYLPSCISTKMAQLQYIDITGNSFQGLEDATTGDTIDDISGLCSHNNNITVVLDCGQVSCGCCSGCS